MGKDMVSVTPVSSCHPIEEVTVSPVCHVTEDSCVCFPGNGKFRISFQRIGDGTNTAHFGLRNFPCQTIRPETGWRKGELLSPVESPHALNTSDAVRTARIRDKTRFMVFTSFPFN